MSGQGRFILGTMLALASAVLACPCAAAETLDASQRRTLLMEANALFDEANKLAATDSEAAKDRYGKAILRFERLVREGGVRNGKLYYNLGNAYFLSGDLGRAILNYRRAEQLLPNDPNLHQNLSYVRNQRSDRITEPQKAKVLKTVFFWHYDLAARTRMALFVSFFLTLWACAVARLFVRHPLLHWGIALAVVLSALLMGSLTAEAVSRARNASGVILADEVIARKGNGETYQPSFNEPLHAGTEFELIEDRPGWYQIALHDGRTSWIPGAAAELVSPN